MGTYLKWIVIIIILLFFITFGVQNSQTVYLNYYFNIQGLELPLYGLVFISILLGIVAGMIIGVTDRLIVKRKLKEMEAEIRELQERIAGQQEPGSSYESHFEEKVGN
jgi:putative membrane protein